MTPCPNCGHDLEKPVTFSCVAKDQLGFEREWCGHHHPTFDDADACPWRPSPAEECPGNHGTCYVVDGDHMYVQIFKNYDPTANQPCEHGNHKSECVECEASRLGVCVHGNPPGKCARC